MALHKLADILGRTVGLKGTHFFLPDIGFPPPPPVNDLSTTLPSYDIQTTSITLPLSPKLNSRLELQPDTVSELPLRLATSSRISPYHILCAVRQLSEPLHRKIETSVAVCSSEAMTLESPVSPELINLSSNQEF